MQGTVCLIYLCLFFSKEENMRSPKEQYCKLQKDITPYKFQAEF